MRHSWFSALVIGGVLGLLTLFLGLQYRWLTEVSTAERERMQKRVETDAARLAEDFDREMQAAYYNFQTGAGVWKRADSSEFNERYDFWKERTAYPELISDIYFFGIDEASAPLRYDVAKRSFGPSEISPELANLRGRFADDKTRQTVYDDVFAMVLPIYEDERSTGNLIVRRVGPGIPPMMLHPDRYGWIVIKLDEQTVKGRIIPDLVAKYFPEGDYKVSVIDKASAQVFATNEVTAEDATAPMFNMSPDNLLFFAKREPILRKISDEGKGEVVINQRVESHTFTRTDIPPQKTGTFNLELKRPGEPGRMRTAMIASSSDEAEPWKLRVQHTAGSIDTFVRNERNKSFALGLGIYLLLVGGIIAILLSAMRSRRFAQRQIDFVSSVSHEFRTPLAVIYSAGENLADGVAKEEGQVARYGNLIKGEGKKLSAMIEQILEFAGANSGNRKFSFASVDVRDVVEEAIVECGPMIEARGGTVETDVQPGLPAVSGDRVALASAIQNLIANSVKYSDGSPWVKISASNGGGQIKIAVEDKGIGISGDDLGQIFEPFYRSKEVVDAQISGNGLGLNLVKKIVEAHGGKVSVESTVGAGSTFTIRLPQASKL